MRTNYIQYAEKAMQILMSQEQYLAGQFAQSKTLSPAIWELVKLRVSQINKCAFCIDMHTKEAISQGESYERIIGLSAWQDMPLYSTTERLALSLAERLTDSQAIEDDEYNAMINNLGDQAIVDLTLAINAINSWNRIAKTFRPEVGSYKPE